MRRFATCLSLLLVILMTACMPSRFDGSRTGNDSQFIMEYRIFDGTDAQTLQLKEGESIDVAIVNTSGTLEIVIRSQDDKILYENDDVSTGSFQIEVKETGKYTITVTGTQAKGSVQFTKG